MTPIALGPGIAPDVTIVDGLVYVAFGTKPDALVLVTLTLDGVEMARQTLPHGFDQSFPRFSGPWLVYRQDEAHGFRAVARHLQTGQTWPYTAAGGTFGLTVHAALGLCAYEWKTPDTPWLVWFGDLQTGRARQSDLQGAPDGIDRIISPNSVTLRKDTRGDVAGIWYPVRAGNLTVGELRDSPDRPNGGIGVQLAGDVLRVALTAQNTPNPRCAVAGDRYAIVCWGQTVQLLLASEAELRALPPAGRVPGPINTEDPMSVPNMLTTVQAVRRLYPTPLGVHHGAFLVDVAKATGGKLLRKDAGTNVPLPSGQLVSQDILVFANGAECFDILQDGEGAAIPAWSAKGMIAGEYIDVGTANPPAVPVPAPVPTPAPPGRTYEQAKADLVELNRFYRDEDGLGRGQDQWRDLGILDWAARLNSGTSIDDVKAQIRTFDEWKRKHPNG